MSLNVSAQDRPAILVKDQDRQQILQKIQRYEWAKNNYDKLIKELEPYVTRHRKDPEWILSRYLMNREEGKHYTNFRSEGRKLVERSGNAPVPTIRVSSALRKPLDRDGYSYRMPAIEDLIPYDTRDTMYLQTTGPSMEWAWVDPGSMIGTINGQINELAFKAAFIYWLTGEADFGQFAEDILLQWGLGARYNEPVEGSQALGYLTFQTLNDASYRSLPLVYDFIYKRISEKHEYIGNLQIAFAKLAGTQLERGYASNNWYAAEMPTMLFAGLALEKEQERTAYMNYFLMEDYGDERIGQKSLDYTVKNWFSYDGHWKEPTAYHNYPVANIMLAAMAAENNGIAVFSQFPELFKASYVMTKFVFPNGKAPGFGDNHSRVSQSTMLLELALSMAIKYNHTDRDRIAYELNKLIKTGYDRSESGITGLIFYESEIASPVEDPEPYPVTNSLEFAQCFTQKLGDDPDHGLMYVVQGATYNHNHANGIAMEIYGKGMVLGVDPGADVTYETDMHREYYSMYAAHNTVIAAGRSGPTGPGFTKPMGKIKLKTIEPAIRQPGVSNRCAFSIVEYNEPSTGTKQDRLMAIVKTTDTTGYYVDIFRSANREKNEYIYHNIGHKMVIRTGEGNTILMRPSNELMEDFGTYGPGYKYFSNRMESGEYEGNVLTTFILNDDDEMVWMNVHSLGNERREYFSAIAPRSHTAPDPYNKMPTPTLVIRQTREAWTRPFVNVFEPSRDHGKLYNVKTVDYNPSYKGKDGRLSFQVRNDLGSAKSIQQIFKGDNVSDQFEVEEMTFQGVFGISSTVNGAMEFLYIGQGIAFGDPALNVRFMSGNAGSLYIEKTEDYYSYSATETFTINFKLRWPGSAAIPNECILMLEQEGRKKEIKARVINHDQFNDTLLLGAILPKGLDLKFTVSETGLSMLKSPSP
jgi:hypothetical protein